MKNHKYPNLKTELLIKHDFKTFIVKHVHAKFQLSSFNPDGLRQNFDIFPRKIQNFSGKL
jgi:hypothetical protein